MVACLLCLENSLSEHSQIDIFSEEGVRLNICKVISSHFWLRPDMEGTNGEQIICRTCWSVVNDFHEFYLRVAEAHNRLDSKCPPLPISRIEYDPLPQEILLKSEEVSSVGKLAEALGDKFFESEVKVEVHDLELLPQIEIIEESRSLSKRAQRACRRRRQTEKSSATVSASLSKRIKKESTSADDASSETELPLSILMNVGYKTDPNDFSTQPENTRKSEEKSNTTVEDTQKRKRGRPKKKIDDQPPAQPTTENSVAAVKAEQGSVSDGEDRLSDGQEFVVGTDDSASSSSEDSNSGLSLPDAEPQERYALIPKRIVVKPKKYRKRPKPLIPPRRMTREEIDMKNAQQAEYDKVIAQFFEKFVCPKCNLLVRNFGEMRSHFRVSHNEDPGYMTCCGRKFHQRKALAEHVYVHWNPEHFKCVTCGRVFQDGRALEVHEQTHVKAPERKDKKVFQCEKCPKSFTTKAAFEYHSFSKHVPKSEFKFTCPECNKKLPTERKLKDHVKYVHDPESAIICDKCGKQVRSQSNLKKHHQIEHSDVPRPVPVPMQCEICGTWLRHLAGLKQHMKTIHEDSGGEHRCHICNKTSTNARALKRHIYHNHECERKFKCTMCEKAFKRPQDLREHTSTHTGEVLYTCPNCPMTFFSNANMYKHRQRLHRAEWEADKKKPLPPNIMQQAVGATAAMKMQQAVGATSAFFANKLGTQPSVESNLHPNVQARMS